MSDLLATLKAGTANRKTIKWPGSDADVSIRVLSDQDYHESALAVDNIYKSAGVPISMQNIADYEAEKTTQILFRAVVDPTTGEHIAPSITEFRKLLVKGVRDTLIERVNTFQDECSPSPLSMSDDDFDVLLQSVKKNAPATTSSVSNIFLARKLITSLAAELATLPADSGSIS